MIDLHMHTINSDGSDTPEELLKKCENLNLEYISITDHDTCKSYEDLKNTNISKIFKGTIIPGCEITSIYKGRVIELLAYGIDTSYISNWMKKYYTEELINSRINYYRNEVLKNLKNLNIEIDETTLDEGLSFEWAVHNQLIKNKEENEKILGKGILDNRRFLFRNGFANPASPLFVDFSSFRPTPKEVVDLIHTAGGKAFLAHPYQYSFDNIPQMITELLEECPLDGVEAFHSSFTPAQMLELKEYAKKNNLYVSGGSDYHGTRKPEISLKTGCNNLNINKNILKWIEID